MPQLPVISGKLLLKFLQNIGFVVVRVNGSHHRLKHPDGRVTTVPVHKNQDLRLANSPDQVISGTFELLNLEPINTLRQAQRIVSTSSMHRP